jgi:hypothetical protein
MEKIFIVPIHVKRMEKSIMPISISGGYVSCYAGGDNYQDAVKRCLDALMVDGLYPHEIIQPIGELAMEDWSRHVAEQWPAQVESLPHQAEFEATIREGKVVYGPIGLYN